VSDPDAVRTRIRLDIAYDGTSFAGWATQPQLRTVQGELEQALATVFSRVGTAPRITVAGRTDAGVHATGQVAHVDLDDAQLQLLRGRRGDQDAPRTLARKLTGIAGPAADVVVTDARLAPEGFDARFSAVWRRYEYRIGDARSIRDPLRRANTVWLPRELDLGAMQAAAGSLLGLHDWAAYCRPREGATTIRDLQGFAWRRLPGGVLLAEVRADAFCHSMVRALVGASIAVGEGRLAPDAMRELRDAGQRTSAFAVAPAKGLTLVEVGYPADDELGTRRADARPPRRGVDTPGLPRTGDACAQRTPARLRQDDRRHPIHAPREVGFEHGRARRRDRCAGARRTGRQGR
jgi:tRNA pseudouridine38-40 synthase